MITIKDKQLCSGCSACASGCPKHCIQMNLDEEGFLYPEVNTNVCINCDKCQRICPIINLVKEVKIPQRAFLVQNQDEVTLKESTSGGAFTALAEVVIKNNGIVFGAAFDENFTVKHMSVTNVEELYKFRNSKYVQSRIENTYIEAKHYLLEGKQVLYSGTPCQVEGLLAYLGKSYDKLLTIDLVCHAVPSPLILEKYKKWRMARIENIESLMFRDKTPYGYQYSQMSIKEEGMVKKHWGVDSDPYLRLFFNDLIDRPSCYNCKFKKRYRASDITMWDCFDVYRIDKQFDDNRGVTRILIHTKSGLDILEKMEGCIVKEIDPEIAVKGVKELVDSVKWNPKRTELFEDCQSMEEGEFFEKWTPDTVRVMMERNARLITEKLGVYRYAKRVVRKIIGKE